MTSSNSSLRHNATLTVDVVIFTVEDDQLKVLLINRDNEPFKGVDALPGGFLAKGETTQQAAARILSDKAGVKNVYVEQLYTFDDPKRDPRGPAISTSYFALVPRDHLELKNDAKVQKPHLLPVNEVKNLAFDHGDIVMYAVSRLRSKLEYTNVVFSLLPSRFTLTQLQKTYEAILNQPLDKRNFQKKFLSLDLIEATDMMTAGGRHRPARLYKFKNQELKQLDRWF